MSGRKDKEGPAGSGLGRVEAREARQASALRANLKRRKAQRRLRQEAGVDGSCAAKDKGAGNRSA